MAGTELDPAKNDPVIAGSVDTAEVPSAAWGWSGEAPRFFRVMAIVIALALLSLTIGNHESRIEDFYLVGFAALLVGIVVRDTLQRRRQT